MMRPPPIPQAINRKYRLTRRIGSGSFGDVFLASNISTGEEYAAKLEPLNRRNPHLMYEAKLMKLLEHGVGIPRIYYYGREGDWVVMVLDLLGPSLEDLFSQCGRIFSLKTTLMIADQMLQRMEYVHNRSIIHRDIKPHNFLIGRAKTDRLIFIIDFGLAKYFRDPRTNEHIPYRDGKNLTGTARYVSINTHLGVEQSRRDDLESIGYVLCYFINGQLPWQGLRANNKREKYKKIMESKINISIDVLCKGLPKEFNDFLKYTRNLNFWERPDYLYCRKLFRDVFNKQQFIHDFLSDWNPHQRRAEDGKRTEEVRRADDPRRLEDSRRAEDPSRRVPDIGRMADDPRDSRRFDDRLEELRRLEERRLEESRKQEEFRRLEEARRAEDARRLEDSGRRFEMESRRADESRRIDRLDERLDWREERWDRLAPRMPSHGRRSEGRTPDRHTKKRVLSKRNDSVEMAISPE